MKTPGVEEFCLRLWELRERQEGDSRKLMRSLIFAMQKDMEGHGGYNPACDARVEWAMFLLRRRVFGERWIEAPCELEAVVAMLLGREESVACGKDLASGN